MARFYIHVLNGEGFLADEEGVDVPDLDAARCSAIYSGADIIADELKQGQSVVNLTLYIEDAGHIRLMELAISAAVGLVDANASS